MQLHPSLTHQLSLARQRDAESAAADARRADAAVQPRQPRSTRRRGGPAPIAGCADAARA